MMQYFCVELQRAWQPFIDCEWECHSVEGQPNLASAFGSEYMVVILEVELGSIRDKIRVCMPLGAFKGIEKNISKCSVMHFGRSTKETASHVANALDNSIATMIVNLATTTLKTSEIIGLQLGDIIATEISVNAPLEVTIGNVVKFKASPGSFSSRKAFQVIEAMPVAND